MREILFRGKRVDNGEWVEGDFCRPNNICFEKIGYCELLERDDLVIHDYAVALETVGQYTGLTDKNGKRIFEGDILVNQATMGFALFENGMFTHSMSAKVNFGQRQPLCYIDDWEAIGNIHDNPELLEDKQ